ncbi:surface antigen [Sporomusaceae bacterium BoRhaA]|uniref:CHAP domain-containing protein n=1 Tax=Pelorhabdus rhamnosifermentans TaxID=2772457 RepID=UPI001C062260|nr:CHAP domain-containing protein [Pelorhabdus rhamnosifermentans]MBU2699108.1 surface antigen [Pelorhabdus rhamnosifermentans]
MQRKIYFSILILYLCFSAITVDAADWHQLPDGICAKYAAQEFEKIAPQPGVNWLDGNYDWVLHANKAGWVTKLMARDVMIGAIAEWQGFNRDGGHVAIVRAVLSDRIIVEENNVGKTVGKRTYSFGGINYSSDVTEGWGKTTIRAIKYDDIIKMDTRKFMGYIWPVRQTDYDKDPAKYQISYTEQMKMKEPRYKHFLEYWAPTYMLKEFDKIAPEPGVNWRGNVETWIIHAQAAGWITRTTPQDVRVGALIIRDNPETHKVKVGIVREIRNDQIVVNSRAGDLYPLTEILQINDLTLTDKNGFHFMGYIWPVRIEYLAE